MKFICIRMYVLQYVLNITISTCHYEQEIRLNNICALYIMGLCSSSSVYYVHYVIYIPVINSIVIQIVHGCTTHLLYDY